MRVAVFGAGIAGLSAAHFLAERGYRVDVYEALPEIGGLARSHRQTGNLPSEYSWRGFGPWYHNTFDLMKRLPSPVLSNATIFDTELSRPIGFNLIPDTGPVGVGMRQRFRLSHWDAFKIVCYAIWLWFGPHQADQLARTYLEERISPQGAQTIAATFGPWVGVDHTRASLHHVAAFFRKNLYPGPPAPYWHPDLTDQIRMPVYPQGHPDLTDQIRMPVYPQGHPDDARGWWHGGERGWLVLNQPINESWFEPWAQYLQTQYGVEFHLEAPLEKFLCQQGQIVGAQVGNMGTIEADFYVLAINPFITKTLLDQTPELLTDPELAKFTPLTDQAPHVQVAFQLGFGEPVKLPGPRQAIILVDSEFDITFFPQSDVWHPGTNLGEGVVTLWSGTATVATVPGKIYGKPMVELTPDEVKVEILYQIYRSTAFQQLVRDHNEGKNLNDFTVISYELWSDWFSARGELQTTQPKWVNTVTNRRYEPHTQTSHPNLFLAGAHTRTSADLYSMEAAVESGRRAADLISGQTTTLLQSSPRPWQMLTSLLTIPRNVSP